MFRIGSLTLANALVLAPMAGTTDTAARRVARGEGAGLVVTEMISAAGLVRAGARTRALMAFHAEEQPVGFQIFGSRPAEMAEAARIVRDAGAALVDINMGCPVKKVCRGGAGSALLRDPVHAGRVMEAVCRAVDCPVTVKMRLGWDGAEADAYRTVARVAEASGVQAISLHPRTRAQGFRGRADWACVARLKADVRVPVIGSGDIVTARGALDALDRSGCDAVMIGRAARGNPWIFSRTLALQAGREPPPVTREQRHRTVEKHLQGILEHYGPEAGWKKARFQLLPYARGLPGSGAFRQRMFALEGEAELRALLRAFFADGETPGGGA